MTRYERQQILFKTAELIRKRREEIAHWLTLELGICYQHALYETGRACDVFMLTGQLAIVDDGQIFSCDVTPQGKRRVDIDNVVEHVPQLMIGSASLTDSLKVDVVVTNSWEEAH